jgi:hypothetical protein
LILISRSPVECHYYFVNLIIFSFLQDRKISVTASLFPISARMGFSRDLMADQIDHPAANRVHDRVANLERTDRVRILLRHACWHAQPGLPGRYPRSDRQCANHHLNLSVIVSHRLARSKAWIVGVYPHFSLLEFSAREITRHIQGYAYLFVGNSLANKELRPISILLYVIV